MCNSSLAASAAGPYRPLLFVSIINLPEALFKNGTQTTFLGPWVLARALLALLTPGLGRLCARRFDIQTSSGLPTVAGWGVHADGVGPCVRVRAHVDPSG